MCKGVSQVSAETREANLGPEPHSPKERLSIFFTLEPVSEPNVRRAVEKINDFPFMVEPVLLLRME